MMCKTLIRSALMLVVAIAMTPPVIGQQIDETDLFQPAAWPVGIAPRVVGTMPVAPLFDELAKLAPADRIRLLAAPNRWMTGTVDRIEGRSPTQYSIFGTLDDDASGFFILVVEEDAVVGMIQAPLIREAYRLGYVAQGVHEMEPIAAKAFGGCNTESGPIAGAAEPETNEAPPSPLCAPHGETPFPRGVCSAPLPQFDTMIYYTPIAQTEAGGTNAMNAECQLAADTANVTYANSGIPARVVLVFRGLISYSETGVFEIDRDRLRNTSDGFMDSVHSARNTYGADFVTLFVSDINYGDCGLAYCLPADSSWGFCVVDRSCASSNFSYAHEIGHLQGCAHNREDAGTGCNFYCDSYGHRFNGNTGVWRTVMSYDTPPPETTEYTRIGWFSNPLVNFDGVPTGASGSCSVSTNNAGTIFGTTSGRELWRLPKFNVWVGPAAGFVYGTFSNPWPTVALGVNAIFAGTATPVFQPNLWIKEGVYNETLTISKPMNIRSCGGTARIGG